MRRSNALVVMGVSAAGKSTIARGVAERLGLPFLDADTVHSAENVAKMAAGTPLTDADRAPWLDAVGSILTEPPGVVVACSALRRTYRDRLRSFAPQTAFVHLHGDRSVLAARAAARRDHFMPAALLDSQLAVLEPLEPDETGLSIDVCSTVDQIVQQVEDWARGR